MRILVTGASGFIGRALVPHLQGLGHDVVPFTRGRNGAPAELRAVADWNGWPEAVEAVIHLAALNPSRGEAAARDDAALMAANASGTKALATRAAREGVRRFVYASTNLVHALRERPVDEAAPLGPQNDYAASKLAGEEAMRSALNGTATQGTILRLPPVYGPGGRGGVAALLKLAGTPLPLPFAAGGGRRSVLSRMNAADALAHAAFAPGAAGETFLVADDDSVSVGEIVALVRAHRGRPARLVPAPAGLLRALARITGRDEAYARLYCDFVVDDRRFRQATGWAPPQTTPEAIAAMLDGA